MANNLFIFDTTKELVDVLKCYDGDTGCFEDLDVLKMELVDVLKI